MPACGSARRPSSGLRTSWGCPASPFRSGADPVTRHVATLGMFVVADRRSRGIGSALMAEAIRWARRHGVLRIELAVYPHNEAAIALYRKFGFDVEGRLVRHARKSYG